VCIRSLTIQESREIGIYTLLDQEKVGGKLTDEHGLYIMADELAAGGRYPRTTVRLKGA
jgi:hypothetical protein